MKLEILSEPYAKVLYEEQNKLIEIQWNRPAKGDEYKRPFLAAIEWAKKGNKVNYFLSDITKQGVVSPDNRRWFENEMIPAAVENGLKRAATITDANVFKVYYINLVLTVVKKWSIDFKVFDDKIKALEFLMATSSKSSQII